MPITYKTTTAYNRGLDAFRHAVVVCILVCDWRPTNKPGAFLLPAPEWAEC